MHEVQADSCDLGVLEAARVLQRRSAGVVSAIGAAALIMLKIVLPRGEICGIVYILHYIKLLYCDYVSIVYNM